MKAITATLAAIGFVGVASVATAATLDSISGQVVVNRGKGPTAVKGPTQVNVGDVVTASSKGSARIVYSASCSVPVAPGTSVTVTHDDHCHLGLAGGPSNGLLIGAGVVAIGAGVAIIVINDPSSP